MDALIAASYVVLFGCCALIAVRLRQVGEIRPYLWVFIAFGIFILACASTHFMEVVTIWWPIYRLSVALKVLCAAASVVTAFLLAKEVTQIIRAIRDFVDILESRRQENLAAGIEIAQRETRVRETEARLQAILDNVVDSIVVMDASRTIVSVNPATLKMFAYDEQELVGKNLDLLMPEPNPDTSMPIGVSRELEGLAKTGRRFAAELTITETAHQGQQMLVGLIRDITERRRTENDLKHQAALLELAHDAIIVIDTQGRVIFWNRGAQDLYGWEAEQVRGLILRELLHTEYPIPFTSYLAIVQNDGRWEGELRQKTRHGQEVVVASRWSLQRDEQQTPGSILLINRDITEGKRVQEVRYRLAAVVDSSDDAIISKNLEGIISAWNRGAEKVFGYSASEMLGKPIVMLMPPDRVFEEAEILARIRKGESIEHFETVRVRKDGARIDVSVTISPIRGADGTICGASKIARDISDRKRAEEAMMEKEQLLSESQRIAHVGSWIYTLDNPGDRIVWSEESYRIYGVSPGSFIPTVGSLLQLILPEDRPIMQKWIASCIAGEKPADFEFRSILPDGAVRLLSGRGELQPALGNGPARMVGTVQDITERKQTEEQLATQTAQLSLSRQELESQTLMLESVLSSMVEGLIVADNQGNFILWNPAAEKILGRGKADLSPADWSAFYGAYLPDKVTPFPTHLYPLVRAIRGEPNSAEIVFRNSGLGQEIWVETNAAPLKDKDGVVRGGVVAFRDVTQRKADELEIRKLNEELEERIAKRTAQLQAANHDLETANHDLESFSYSVSHDLRTPLRHISGFSRILTKDFAGAMDVQAREYVERIEDAVARMAKLIDALLSLAKLGRRSLQLRTAELNPIVEDVIALLKQECDGREVEWRVARLPAIECDPILIGQVFQNLLGNALKYSRRRDKAVIEVSSIEDPGKPATIFVRDNGAGFNMEYAEKLFGVFQRMHNESEFEGTGIGLATVQRIIKKHGGTVWAEAAEDHGATFYFALEQASPLKELDNQPETLLK